MATPHAREFKPDVAYMPVPRCDQCRFWRRLDPESENYTDHQVVDLGECLLLSEDLPDPVGGPERMAFPHYDDGPMKTLKSFGCVQWEQKQDE